MWKENHGSFLLRVLLSVQWSRTLISLYHHCLLRTLNFSKGHIVSLPVVKLYSTSSATIPVGICYMTANTLIYKPKSEIRSSSKAKVIDISSYIPQDITSEPPLSDIPDDTSNLTPEKYSGSRIVFF